MKARKFGLEISPISHSGSKSRKLEVSFLYYRLAVEHPTYCYSTVTETIPTLSDKDIKRVRIDIYEARAKWYDIGIELEIPTGTLKSIKSMYDSPAECLVEMLDTWLKQVDPKPSWRLLINALEQPAVGEERLAERLKQKYYPSKKGNTV